MAIIKSYTDISQSKKLAEILPLESADMMWTYDFTVDDINGINVISEFLKLEEKDVPAWSLAALLNILNSIDGWYPGIDAQVGEDNLWRICMFSYETGSDISTAATNKELVDTCYEVIIKLKEKNLL